MNPRIRPISAPWIARLPGGAASHQPSPRPGAPVYASRPGIAARWKPRDRVSAAGT